MRELLKMDWDENTYVVKCNFCARELETLNVTTLGIEAQGSDICHECMKKRHSWRGRLARRIRGLARRIEAIG